MIPKGAAAEVKARGIGWLREQMQALFPDLDLSGGLTSEDDLHLLTVELDRLDTWHRPGLLAIGDAAHAMSPVGGIGINLAIQDAVAAANVLAGPLARGEDPDALLAKVQKRREFPTKVIQAGQRARSGQHHRRRVLGHADYRSAANRAPARPLPAAAAHPGADHRAGRAAGAGSLAASQILMICS
jgi:2-polyprenyl-6-methoxyphenol hydroxylase-like FAD-dependent oxidoreductase